MHDCTETPDVESGLSDPQRDECPKTRFRKFVDQVRLALRVANAIAPSTKQQQTEDRQRRDSFLDRYTAFNTDSIARNHSDRRDLESEDQSCACVSLVILPDGDFYFYWMIVVCCAVLYNYWLIMPRIAFQALQTKNAALFFVLDYLSDVIYVLDIAVRFHLGFFEEGMVVCQPSRLKQNYLRSVGIWFDFVTLLPLDLMYIVIGVEPSLRLPRLVKGFRVLPVSRMIESRLHYSIVSRIATLVHFLSLCIHWDACFYFLISRAEGIVSDDWVYPMTLNESSVLIHYLFSFHWATLALTTIGDLPVPHTAGEFLFTIINYMLGVLIFATLVGQLGQIVSNANEAQAEFEKLMDSTKNYLRKCGAPKSLQQRITRWYNYSRTKGRLAHRNEATALRFLPEKLKADVAVYANVAALQKVDLFKEIPVGLLHELVLKMKSVLFTPGDVVCRCGDIGREVFIVKDGKLAVTTELGKLIVTLGEGDYFGEISLLAVNNSNRRTANVYSVGYSELLVLHKHDLEEPFHEHPEFKAALIERATYRLNQAWEKEGKSANELETDLQSNSGNQLFVPNTSSVSSSQRPTGLWVDDGSTTGSFFWRGKRQESLCNVHEPKCKERLGAETSCSGDYCSVHDGANESALMDERNLSWYPHKRSERRGTKASMLGLPQFTVQESFDEYEMNEITEKMKDLESERREQQSCMSNLEMHHVQQHNIPTLSISRPNSSLSISDSFSYSRRASNRSHSSKPQDTESRRYSSNQEYGQSNTADPQMCEIANTLKHNCKDDTQTEHSVEVTNTPLRKVTPPSIDPQMDQTNNTVTMQEYHTSKRMEQKLQQVHIL